MTVIEIYSGKTVADEAVSRSMTILDLIIVSLTHGSGGFRVQLVRPWDAHVGRRRLTQRIPSSRIEELERRGGSRCGRCVVRSQSHLVTL